jgi:hypothetical protein
LSLIALCRFNEQAKVLMEQSSLAKVFPIYESPKEFEGEFADISSDDRLCNENRNFPIWLVLNGLPIKQSKVGDIFKWSIAKTRGVGCLRNWLPLVIQMSDFGLTPAC